MRKTILATVGAICLAVSFAAFLGPIGGASHPGTGQDHGQPTTSATDAVATAAGGTPSRTDRTTGGVPSRATEAPSTATPAPPGTTPPTAAAPADRSLDSAVNETNLSRLIVEEINARRVSRGLDPLATYVDPHAVLADMAAAHSERMAQLGTAAHVYNGTDSEDRYRDRSLFYTCKFESNGGGHVVTAEFDRLEVVDRVDGSRYETDSTTPRKLADRIATDIVDAWFSDRFKRGKLQYENAKWIGVGTEVGPDGDVYVTANVC